MLKLIKKFGPVLVVVLASLVVVFDQARFVLVLSAFGLCALVLLGAYLIIGEGKEHGLLPVAIPDLVRTASLSPVGSAMVFLGIVALVVTVMLVTSWYLIAV